MAQVQRFEVGPRLSQAVVHGDTIYLAGQVNKSIGDVTGQTRAILEQIDHLLASTGSTKERIVSATIYLADIATFAQMNAAWDAWLPKGAPPARTTVEARLAAPEYLVEITVVAVK
jgi:enamine deaminase RidA (YjgF/YER057c/UK114 family)